MSRLSHEWSNWAAECRAIRTTLGLSLVEFGRLLGVSKTCVYNWEHGLRLAPQNELTRREIRRLRRLAARGAGPADVLGEAAASKRRRRGRGWGT